MFDLQTPIRLSGDSPSCHAAETFLETTYEVIKNFAGLFAEGCVATKITAIHVSVIPTIMLYAGGRWPYL
jgi:hypothetical protein